MVEPQRPFVFHLGFFFEAQCQWNPPTTLAGFSQGVEVHVWGPHHSIAFTTSGGVIDCFCGPPSIVSVRGLGLKPNFLGKKPLGRNALKLFGVSPYPVALEGFRLNWFWL